MYGYTTLEWISLGINILSLIGIGAVGRTLNRVFNMRRRGRGILRFSRSFASRTKLSILAMESNHRHHTNSELRVGSDRVYPIYPDEDSDSNFMQGIITPWTMDGIMSITEMSQSQGYRKNIEVHIVEKMLSPPDNDVVIIGDNDRNRFTQRFIRSFNSIHPQLSLSWSIKENHEKQDYSYEITVGERVFTVEAESDSKGNAQNDLALLVVWRNPFISRSEWRRGILCKGFTSLGNLGAVQYLQDTVENGSLKKFYRATKPKRGLFRKEPEFIVVVSTRIVDNRYQDAMSLALIPIHKSTKHKGKSVRKTAILLDRAQ